MKFHEILKESNKVVAYWITPKSEIIPVSSNHIDIIIDYPEVFGVTLDWVKNIYKKHKEPLGEIGSEANREILNHFFDKGWIRIRLNDKLGICLITIRSTFFNKRIKEDITNFVSEYIPKNYDVTITDVEGGLHLKLKSGEIKKGKILESKDIEGKLVLHEKWN